MRAPDRILTTHTGSLPRPASLTALMASRYIGEAAVDEALLEDEIAAAVQSVVTRQKQVGIDVPSDGECSKVGFSQYVHERYSGFTEVGTVGLIIDDVADFPGLAERATGRTDARTSHAMALFMCEGPIRLRDPDGVHKDIARFKSALGDLPPPQAFLGAPTPGQVAFNFPNRHYASHEDYLGALAEAMRYEYRAITDAGFNLQLDSPDLAMGAHVRTDRGNTLDLETHSALALDALAHAIDGIPRHQLRLHICWGNYAGPHHRDIALATILPQILQVDVETFSFEAANPRHAHEWEVFREIELPEGAMVMPGVIDVTTNRIEHPRLVAQRLLRFAEVVGRENVIAGTDCGFSTVAGWELVDPEVCWAKLESLVAGAGMASRELWG